MKALFLVITVALVTAAPEREKRQVGCLDAFQNVPSPCSNNPTKMVYFPHPSDVTKFLQCDAFGRMFIVQCPAGEHFNQATVSCIGNQPATQAPPQNVNSPCTAAAVSSGKLYFSFAGDNTRFIHCGLNGDASILTCPSPLVWNENILSCVYVFTAAVTPSPASVTGAGLSTNPCRGQFVTSAGLYFSHPDPNKFIECDIAGGIHVMTCPSGLVWNEYSKTCISPYLVQQGSIIGSGVGKK